jgi:hypothetical protein
MCVFHAVKDANAVRRDFLVARRYKPDSEEERDRRKNDHEWDEQSSQCPS